MRLNPFKRRSVQTRSNAGGNESPALPPVIEQAENTSARLVSELAGRCFFRVNGTGAKVLQTRLQSPAWHWTQTSASLKIMQAVYDLVNSRRALFVHIDGVITCVPASTWAIEQDKHALRYRVNYSGKSLQYDPEQVASVILPGAYPVGLTMINRDEGLRKAAINLLHDLASKLPTRFIQSHDLETSTGRAQQQKDFSRHVNTFGRAAIASSPANDSIVPLLSDRPGIDGEMTAIGKALDRDEMTATSAYLDGVILGRQLLDDRCIRLLKIISDSMRHWVEAYGGGEFEICIPISDLDRRCRAINQLGKIKLKKSSIVDKAEMRRMLGLV